MSSTPYAESERKRCMLKRIMPHHEQEPGDEIFKELLEYEEHLDASIPLVNELHSVRRKKANMRYACPGKD